MHLVKLFWTGFEPVLNRYETGFKLFFKLVLNWILNWFWTDFELVLNRGGLGGLGGQGGQVFRVVTGRSGRYELYGRFEESEWSLEEHELCYPPNDHATGGW